jgi:WD40 repeat protein
LSRFDPNALPVGANHRFGSARLRHQSPVSTIQWSPDSEQLISAGWDLWIHIWRATDGEWVQSLRCPEVSLSMLSLSANGERMAGANYRHGLWVWDLKSGEILWRLGGKDLEIDAIALSATGNSVAALSPTGCTEYNLSNGSEVQHHELPAGAAIAYGDSDDLHICASILGLIQLWRAGQVANARALGASSSGITAAQFSATAQAILLQHAGDPHLDIVTASGELIQRVAHENPLAASLSADGQLLALASPKEVSLWANQEQQHVFSRELVTHLALSPNGRRLACLDESYGIHLVDTASLIPTAGSTPAFPPESIAVDSAGTSVLLATRGGGLHRWDRKSGDGQRLPHSIPHPRALRLTPDGDFVITRIAEAKVGALSLAKPELQEVFGAVHGEPELLCFNQTGTVWSYVDNNLIYVHNRDARTPQQIPSPGAHQVETLRLSPSGDTLAIAWLGGVIGLRETLGDADKSLTLLRKSGPAVHACAFSPDGLSLAIADVTGQIEVWGLKPLKQRWSTQMGSISSLAWSPSSRLLAAGEYYGDIVVFNDGEQLATWHSEAGEVMCLCFNASGEQVFSGHKNTTVLQWSLPERS